MRRTAFGAALIALALAGCGSNSQAVFVTSTDIGINADSATRSFNVGYDRVEAFVGPVYPDQGAAPAAFADLRSNLSPFSPKIRQVYATGQAAELVTIPADAAIPNRLNPAQQPPPMSDERRVMVFGTSSTVGAKLGFAATSVVPDSISFGYKRKEMSIIPLRSQDPKAPQQDHYAPVLASIDLDLSSASLPETDMKVAQFVATGGAAVNLAAQPEFRTLFKDKASETMRLAAASNARRTGMADALAACVAPGGTLDPQSLNAVAAAAAAKGVIRNAAYWTAATSAADVAGKAKRAEGDALALGSFVQTNPGLCAG